MLPPDAARVGYVVKVYPRYSETFIVTEVLAHETAGLAIELFALRPPTDSHFQDLLARVRAPVHYVPHSSLDAGDFWAALGAIGAARPDLWPELVAARAEDARDVYQALWLARAARERGLTHLHAHFASTATTVTRLAARFAGLPYSFTAHAKDIFHLDVQPQDLRRKLGEAAAVVTVSDYNRDYLRAAHGTLAAHVERIYNGLELDRFPYTAPIDRPPHLVAVGRLVEKKGFADLIDASALLAERGRSFTCQIIGAGELEGALRAQVERLGLAAVIEFTGLRPQREIVDLIRRAAVFAAPCV
ncbi:MAG: glycosyltransferase, partial [Chloroflexi bacterium]|nr:glycosyltransferase [Chloroflexota bacterium]